MAGARPATSCRILYHDSDTRLVVVSSRTPLQIALGLALFGATAASAGDAFAGACCGDASGLGDRLAEAEIASGTFGLTVSPRFGSFDADGDFYAVSDTTTDVRIEPVARALVRVRDNLELAAGWSGVVNVRGTDGESVVGGGAGDVRALVRATAYRTSQHRWWPGVSAIAGVVVPTGVGAAASTQTLDADVTGQGAGELVLGATVDKLIEGVFFVRADSSVGIFLQTSVDGAPVQRAPRWSTSIVMGPVFQTVALGVGVRHEHEDAPSTAPADTAARSRTEMSLVGVFDVVPNFAIVANVAAPLPVAGFGSQDLASVSSTLAARISTFQ